MLMNFSKAPVVDLTIPKKYEYGWMVGIGAVLFLYWLKTREGR